MKIKIIGSFAFLCLLFSSCEEGNKECACYNEALKGNKLTEECKEFVDGLTEEQLKEKANECFGKDIEDLSIGVGL